MWAEAGGHAGNDLHGGEGASPAVCGGAAPLSSVAAGSGSSEGVREEGERGGLGTLRTIAAAWPPPTPMPRALAALICSVTAVGVRGMEGLGAPSSEAGILKGRRRGVL